MMYMDGRIKSRVRHQDSITKRYGKHWFEAIRLWYQYYDNLDDVANVLGIGKPTIYRWIGRDIITSWKKENRTITDAYLKEKARAMLDE